MAAGAEDGVGGQAGRGRDEADADVEVSLGLGLVAHAPDGARGRTDERDPLLLAARREQRVLRQEAVAWVDRLDVGDGVGDVAPGPPELVGGLDLPAEDQKHEADQRQNERVPLGRLEQRE